MVEGEPDYAPGLAQLAEAHLLSGGGSRESTRACGGGWTTSSGWSNARWPSTPRSPAPMRSAAMT